MERRKALAVVALAVALGAAGTLAWTRLRSDAPSAPPEGTVRGSPGSPPSAAPGLAGIPSGGRPKAGSDASGASESASATSRPPSKDSFLGRAVDEKGRPLSKGVIGLRLPPYTVGSGTSFVELDTEGRFDFAWGPAHAVRARVWAKGRVLAGSEAHFERGNETRLVLVPSCELRVRVLDDTTGARVRAFVTVVAGWAVNSVFSSDLDAPYADAQSTGEEGIATLECEGGPVNVIVEPEEHAPLLVPRVNVPPEGRDLDVRVKRGGVVEGRVLAAGGEPVRDATVRLTIRPVYRRDVRTEADGRFRFAGTPVGDPHYLEGLPVAGLTASAEGFASAAETIEPPKPGESLSREVRLPAAHRLAGRVVHPGGAPAPDFKVSVAVNTDSSLLFEAPHALDATSDADGRFVVERVPAGDVQVTAGNASGTLYARTEATVPETGEAQVVEILLPDRRGRLTVRVVSSGGAPVAGARIEAKSGPPVIQTVSSGVTDAAGVAAIEGLPTDFVTVHVLPIASAVMVREVRGADLAGGTIEVRLDAGEVAGVATRPDGSPARVRIALERLVGGCMLRGEPCETDAEGRFRFAGLPEGKFELWVEGEENVLVTRMPWVSPGETDVKVVVASVEEEARFHVEVALVDDATGKPVLDTGRMTAELAPSGGASGPRMTLSQSHEHSEPGRFMSYTTVPPGAYDLTLSTQGWRPARVSGLRIPRVGDVPVARLDRGLRVEGRVVAPDGKPIAGAWVSVGGQGAPTGDDGRYSMTGVEAGAQEAKASGDFSLEEKTSVRVPLAAGERLDWTLRPAGVLEIRLGDGARDGSVERVVATPLAAGEPLGKTSDIGVLRWDTGVHGTRLTSVPPGRYRVEAWQGKTAHPAQEVDVRAGETTTVKFPAD